MSKNSRFDATAISTKTRIFSLSRSWKLPQFFCNTLKCCKIWEHAQKPCIIGIQYASVMHSWNLSLANPVIGALEIKTSGMQCANCIMKFNSFLPYFANYLQIEINTQKSWPKHVFHWVAHDISVKNIQDIPLPSLNTCFDQPEEKIDDVGQLVYNRG